MKKVQKPLVAETPIRKVSQPKYMHVQTSIPTTSATTPVATAVAKPNSTQQVKAPAAAAPAKAAVVKQNAPVAVAAKA